MLDSEAPTDEPMCRICYETGESAETGPLFCPCLCSGSMGHVHMECLDHWRNSSANPRSFYRCDNCHFDYKFGRAYSRVDRFTLARFLSSRFAVHALSVLVLVSIIFVAGFVAKSFDSTLTWWDVLDCFKLEHLIYGSAVTGLGSLLGWAISLIGYGGGRLMGDMLGGAGRWGVRGGGGGNDKAGNVIVVILVVIGLLIALSWIYDRIEQYSRRTTRAAMFVVLDARSGRPPAATASEPPKAAPSRRLRSPARARPHGQ